MDFILSRLPDCHPWRPGLSGYVQNPRHMLGRADREEAGHWVLTRTMCTQVPSYPDTRSGLPCWKALPISLSSCLLVRFLWNSRKLFSKTAHYDVNLNMQQSLAYLHEMQWSEIKALMKLQALSYPKAAFRRHSVILCWPIILILAFVTFPNIRYCSHTTHGATIILRVPAPIPSPHWTPRCSFAQLCAHQLSWLISLQVTRKPCRSLLPSSYSLYITTCGSQTSTSRLWVPWEPWQDPIYVVN